MDSISLSLSLSLCLSLSLSLSLSPSLSLSICISVSLSLSLCDSVCVCVCPSQSVVPYRFYPLPLHTICLYTIYMCGYLSAHYLGLQSLSDQCVRLTPLRRGLNLNLTYSVCVSASFSLCVSIGVSLSICASVCVSLSICLRNSLAISSYVCMCKLSLSSLLI